MRLLIIFASEYLYFVIIAIALIVIVRTKSAYKVALVKLSAVSLSIAFIVGKIFNHIIFSPRPFVVEGVAPLFIHSADNGFPSDHTLLVMTIAGIIFTNNRKVGVMLGILGLFVGVARVFAKVHHPVDIVGSTIIAITCVYFSQKLLSSASKKYS